ncbi:hypothetical protein C5N14_04195 [Micromonospora sp. MW-13]|uniref:hypothetical protein n=1 Tax=unclassified Micromonospora TaxID=2617518 RepID=UPI000E44E5D6|nr:MULTISPECIES: hypothetical protein [unclassified Micromonospora]MCX4474257.1 DUF4185 domain-containing protein [Micromonospora sp. NBC_01655]RGC69607.1 hypothetical protein C5N14_04195 [Micromonospora sp. MW-13]
MTLRLVEFVVAGNEASDLLPVRSPALLAAHRARRGFWTVLDEGPVERCLALLLEHEDGGWAAHHVAADAGEENGRTEDGEALAHHDGWVYVFGSHFGSKGGPLRPRRAFVARFREADAAGGRLPVRVVRNRFRLHRAVNDALAGAELATLPPGERVRDRFIVETVARGTARAKSWVTRLAAGDLPINVEAAAFTPDGTALLGLRFPVTADGDPILVEVAGVPEMFDAGGWPRALGAYAVTGVTPPGALAGFRAVTPLPDGGYAAIVGSIDALGKGSVLLDDHPQGGHVTSRHVRFRLEKAAGHLLPAELVADLAPFHHVEGLAEEHGHCWYVTDEDHRIALWIG